MTVITRVNHFELRLINDGPELEAAQALRYQVFYREMGAHASAEMRACGRDFDRYDAIAEHLVVVDLDRSSGFRPWVAGCYRVLRGPVAARHGGFYTANEFDLGGVTVPRDASWSSAAPACTPSTAAAPRCSSCGAASPAMSRPTVSG